MIFFLPQSPLKCAKLKTIIKPFFALFAFFAAKVILKFSLRPARLITF